MKVNRFRFPIQVSGFPSGCDSFKYVPPLCLGTLRILLKMLTIGVCDVCLHDFQVILRRYMVRVGNRDQK